MHTKELRDLDRREMMATIALVAEATGELDAHAGERMWGYVEGEPAAGEVLRAQWLAVRRAEPLASPGLADLALLVAGDSCTTLDGEPAPQVIAWLAGEDRRIAGCARATTAFAVRSGQDLHRASLRHEFWRRMKAMETP